MKTLEPISVNALASGITAVFYFRSSDGKRLYETLRHRQGGLSCNCPGWTKRVYEDGTRSCKHTRLVDNGLGPATAEVYSTREGSRHNKPAKQPAAKAQEPAKPSMVRAIELEDPE